jgi:hypothetical protein
VQPVAQRGEGADEVVVDRSRRAPHHRGDLVVREPVEPAQRQRLALARRQVGHPPPELRAQVARGGQLVGRRGAPGPHGVRLGRQQARPGARVARRVEREVAHRLVQERPQRPLGVERRAAPPHPHERLLRRVARRRLVAEQRDAVAHERVVGGVEQLGERLGVVGREAARPVGVRVDVRVGVGGCGHGRAGYPARAADDQRRARDHASTAGTRSRFVAGRHARRGPTFRRMRVVSLCPSLTELVFALGRGHALVGRTRFCHAPAGAVEAVERVGGTKNPKVERIVALRPDLVLLNEEENRREDAEALAAAACRCT